ncbi:hypothetical protein OIPHN330_12850 [Citrobacter freundii]|nr:hypothetical protein OIPHN330_12850 [Citrobacter freundii]BEJ38572.1 hypothetical protein OIPHN354_12840 [Citrobacter freundii]
MDSVHHIWCPLSSQEFQDLPDGAETTLTMYSPNGKKDGIQIIPLSEVAAKDEFLNIKNVSRDDMMAAHRVPPQMMGIMPSNVGGFGDVEKASRVFVRNELIPLQKRLMELNEWLNDEIIRFDEYKLGDA